MLCQHEPCGCRVGPEARYCSARCARNDRKDLSQSEMDPCRCGHAECRPENARLYDPADGDSPLETEDVSNPPVTEDV